MYNNNKKKQSSITTETEFIQQCWQNILEDVSMAQLEIGGNFVSGNIDISVTSNEEGSRCLHVNSVGDEDHQIPMIRNITSTKVAAAWKKKMKPKKTILDKCKDILTYSL